MTKTAYGLDFGTSNSAIAIINSSGQSQVLPIGSQQSKTIKSVLFFPYVPEKKRLHFVGDDALTEYLAADKRGRFIQSIKSILPEESFSGTIVQGDFLGADDLVAMILRYIKKKADEITGLDITNVVLGRPAKFSEEKSSEDTAQQRLFIAAQKAGFGNIEFQLEPIAAALHYESSLSGPKTVLVADLGGGTSDFTIMRLSPEKMKSRNRKDDILSTAGVYIGGDGFDSDIMWNKLVPYFGLNSQFKSYDKWLPMPVHIMHQICKWQHIGLLKNREMRNTLSRFRHNSDDPEAIARLQSLINDDLGFALFQKIEEAKINLSSLSEADLSFQAEIIKISETLSRKELNDFISEKILKISETVDETMKLANIGTGDIDAVFLTGGTSLTPIIRDLFEKKFGSDKINSLDSFTSVVSGLALSSKLFFEV
jgi:hypothetical chaperone protein